MPVIPISLPFLSSLPALPAQSVRRAPRLLSLRLGTQLLCAALLAPGVDAEDPAP